VILVSVLSSFALFFLAQDNGKNFLHVPGTRRRYGDGQLCFRVSRKRMAVPLLVYAL
jgi:hypothetical protein